MRTSGWLLALAGCAALSSGGAAADLRIGVLSEVTTLDPHYFHLTANTEIDKLVYSALVTQAADLSVIPDLATSWQALDETHWQFRLRPGVKWHDGSAFTADDVVFTCQRARNVPNSPASFLQFLKHVVKATAVDDLTLEIETDQPDPILLNELLNVWIVSRKAGANASTADYNSGKAAIGTGPYREAEWAPGDRMALRRFDGYFGAKPEWERVTYKPITNDAARVAALLSGDVDLIGNVPANDVAALQGKAGFSVATMASNRCYFWTLDVDRDNSPQITDMDGAPMAKNPLKDARVRQAMSMAIDRNALVSRVMQGQAVAASQFMPDGVPGTSALMKPVAYDLDGAQAAGRGGVGEGVRGCGELHQRPLSGGCAGQPSGGADVDPAGAEGDGFDVAEGDVLPARGEAGVQRDAERQFHGYRGAFVAVAVPAQHVRSWEGAWGRESRALQQSAA